MTCANCTHYHDLTSKLMCDKGLMEVMIVGIPRVVVTMPHCVEFDKIHVKTWDDDALEDIKVQAEKQLAKIDKRTKAFKNAKR